MNQRTLGKQGLVVSELGLGCMGMSEFSGDASQAEKGVTPSQLALEENVAAVNIRLTERDLRRIDEAAPKGVAVGQRYADMSAVNR